MFTLYGRVALSLPGTSYIKMVEIWLLFHILIPFFIFFILFWEEHKPSPTVNVSNKTISARLGYNDRDYLNKFSILYLPCVICIFVFTFFAICFTKYYS